jgi:SAM-dependent methyltransferase
MDLPTFERLLAPAGQALLADLMGRDLRDATLLAELERLRARTDAELARAALDTALLRRRAAGRIPHAERLYFTREALEQATAAPVAAHRAARLAPHAPHVADICCGIGGDALALAAAGARVSAVDYDPLRLAMARANAAALGLENRISFIEADVLATPPPAADAIFCDPARRSEGRRVFDVEAYQPPLAHVLGWRAQCPALCVKLAPGVARESLPQEDGYELEFVSLDGELKEAALWCGPLATHPRRATLLASGEGQAAQTYTLTGIEPSAPHAPHSALSAPLAYLYEPDPAVIRAQLVAGLAAQLGAAQLDAEIAYLVADKLVSTPFARAWRVLEWLPFSLKRLRARVRAYDPGPVTVKKRGSPLDTDALARQLSGRGAAPLVVVLTRVQGKPAALLCAPAA